MSDDIHMKPVLAKAIEHAFVLAVSDCLPPPERPDDMDRYDARKRVVQLDVYKITDEEWAQIDPMALAQNLCCRLLGTGGWQVGGVYSANATVNEVIAACFGEDEANRDPIADVKEALGLMKSPT